MKKKILLCNITAVLIVATICSCSNKTPNNHEKTETTEIVSETDKATEKEANVD